MSFDLIKDLLDLLKEFNTKNSNYSRDLDGFKQWVHDELKTENKPENNIHIKNSEETTLISSLNRYFDVYNQKLVHDPDFFALDDFIYLVSVKIFGSIDEQELIARSIKGQKVGKEVLERLLNSGWIKRADTSITLTQKAYYVLERQISLLIAK